MKAIIGIAVLLCIIQGSLAASTSGNNTNDIESKHQEIVDPDGKIFDAYIEKDETEEREMATVTNNGTVVERIYMDKHTGIKITESLERNECYIQKMDQENGTEEENDTSSCFTSKPMDAANITDQIKEVCQDKSMFQMEATSCEQQGRMSRYFWYTPQCILIPFPIRTCGFRYLCSRYCCRSGFWGCRKYCRRCIPKYMCWYEYLSVRVCF